MRMINKAKLTFKQIFEEISIPEYISWWVVRGLLIYAIVRHSDSAERLLFGANFLALFTLPVFRFIFPKDGLIGNLHFRCQTLINFIEFAGSFLGNYISIRRFYSRYDRILHLISGAVCVFIGYFIVLSMSKMKGKKLQLDPSIASLCSVGFSFIIIPLWEVMEFVGDFIWGTNNQGFNIAPSNEDLWFRLFGPGNVPDGAQFPVWDTVLDMLDASITAAIAGVILFVILKKKSKKLSTEKQTVTA